MDVGAPAADIAAAWPGRDHPAQLRELWTTGSGARLFEDIDYGQWGLVPLPPALSASRTAVERRRRPRDYQDGDVVLGEFLGDQDLLVLEAGAAIRVALPLDDREARRSPAASLGEFLTSYLNHRGEKFWEKN